MNSNKVHYSQKHTAEIIDIDEILAKAGRMPIKNTQPAPEAKQCLIRLGNMMVMAEYQGKTPNNLHAIKVKDTPIPVQQIKALIAKRQPGVKFNIINGSILSLKGTTEQLRPLMVQGVSI